MSDTTASLSRKINSADDLQSVVRTMKALSASNIGQYEQSVRALADYYRTLELGLMVCFRASKLKDSIPERQNQSTPRNIGAIVFGSDQGLVGQFNEVVADYAFKTLETMFGEKQVWAVGARVHARLSETDLISTGLFAVPHSVKAITPLIGQILIEYEALHTPSTSFSADQTDPTELYLFYNRPTAESVYEPVSQRLLPLDKNWVNKLNERPWPTANLPEVFGDCAETLHILIREYLFVSLFRACAESLASENASRLAAMERADKNIDELLENFHKTFHQLRQNGIDEELFDVISGYEALSNGKILHSKS